MQEGNDYDGEYTDLLFVNQPVSSNFFMSTIFYHVYCVQVFHVELVVKATELMFSPPLSELEAVVHRLISTIVGAAQGLPRV